MEKALVIDDALVSDRDDRGFIGKLGAGITGLVSGIIGDKEDMEKEIDIKT